MSVGTISNRPHLRHLKLILIFPVLAAGVCWTSHSSVAKTAPVLLGKPIVDPYPTLLDTRVHYHGAKWLSRSLSKINFSRALAELGKPWVMARLPSGLNQVYRPGGREAIPARIKYIITRQPARPLKSVLWIGPKDWDSRGGGSNSEAQAVRQEYRLEIRAEYLRSFQGLVIFRVNEKVKGMHRIDPIWQVSERWKGMVKPAWQFCKKHKTWFLKNSAARHTADLKKLLADNNLLLAANAFRLLCQSDHFRKAMFARKLFAFNGVRLGAFTELLIDHASHANLVHPKHLAARMVKDARTKSQRKWLLAGAYGAANFSSRVSPFYFGFEHLPDAAKAANKAVRPPTK